MPAAWLVITLLAAVEPTGPAAAAGCPPHLQFLQAKCAQWQASVLPQTLPAARGNAVADKEAAAALGLRIFYDNRFSRSGSGVACASCHDPEHAFAERKPTSHTLADAGRNAPDLINAAWYTQAHFWDGKVDNLWSAPLFTFERDTEMGSTRLHVVHTLAAIYKIRYEKVFGPLPDFSDTRRFPVEGKPGSPPFDAMSKQDQRLVNRVYADIGKALEAYIRKLAAGRSQFDDFVNGSSKALSADAQRGMVAFTRHGCDGCHSGPTFSDEKFHNLGYPGQPGRAADPGRAAGIVFAKHWQFGASGEFADSLPAAAPVKVANSPGDPTGLRTPTLRNLNLTDPYGHDGAFNTLDQVIDAHAAVLPKHAAPDAQDKHDIIAFLHSLGGRPPPAPWNYWPGG
jgi:cytochrome c peroxidase